MTRRSVWALLALAAALLLGACGSAGTQDDAHRSAASHPARARHAATSGAAQAAAQPATSSTPPPPNPCAHNVHPQLVKVDLHAQHLWMCRAHEVAYSTPITSGIVGEYTHTPTGDYAIQALQRHATLTLITGQQYQVKYWIPFDAPLFGFHDASWQTFPFGSSRYRAHGSHGCVHMPLHAIAFLFRWAHVGTPVHIRI